jgi:hypothetical protein
VCGEDGAYKGSVGVDEGLGYEPIWRVDAEIFPGARHVRPGFFEQDDRWVPAISG